MPRFPVAFRPPAFASRSSDSRQGIGPSSRSAYRAKARTLTGLPRSTRTSCDRGGCLLYPGDGDAHPADMHSSAGACRFPAASPCTPLPHPIGGAARHETSTEVHAIHPSGLPLACGPRMERAPLGFSPSFEPRRLSPTTHVRVGTGHRARARNYALDISRPSNPRAHSKRATSCRSHLPSLSSTPDNFRSSSCPLPSLLYYMNVALLRLLLLGQLARRTLRL